MSGVLQLKAVGQVLIQAQSRMERKRAFTLIELLIVIAIIALLAGLLLPSLNRARGRAMGLVCGNHLRQLQQAMFLYANDHTDRLVLNLDGDPRVGPPPNLDHNWVDNVLTWELDPGNTNLAFIQRSPMGAYVGGVHAVFRCPSDRVLSQVQREAGWIRRVRSMSLNAMVGDAGANVTNGGNRWNPGHRQYLRLSDVGKPTSIYSFLDEHPDSIADGYFLIRIGGTRWIHLPGSYHGRAANLSFMDGHVETHRWRSSETCRPAQPDSGPIPFEVSAEDRADFDWLAERTSEPR